MMSWFVLIFAIVIAIYVERMLVPLTSTPRLRLVFRWNYVNGLMMASGNLHPWLKWVQTAMTLCFGAWVVCWLRAILRIEQEKEMQRQILREKREAEQRLFRERQEAERIALHEELMRRWVEDVRVARLQYLATKGCPMGLDCDAMGSDGQGDCSNYKACGERQYSFR